MSEQQFEGQKAKTSNAELYTGSPGTGMTFAPVDPLIRRALAQVQYITNVDSYEDVQWQPNPLVQMNIPGMLRERTAVALSGDFGTAHDYAAVFNSKGSVTFLFYVSEAAQQVAWMLCGEWDGLNTVTLNNYDEVALATAANLAGSEFCCVGQACVIERHIPTLSELAHWHGLKY